MSNHSYKYKNNTHNRLYNHSLNKQKIIRELEQKFSQNEEKEYTFSPKTNNGKIKCKFSNKEKNELFELNINNPRYSYSFKSSNINNNKNINNDAQNNNKNQIIEYNNEFSRTNPLFYHNKTINGNGIHSYNLKKQYNKINYDNYNLFNKNNKFGNNNNKIIYNKKNKYNSFFNINSFFDEKIFNKTSRNLNDIKKSITNKSAVYLYNHILNNNQVKNSSNSPNNAFSSNDYILIRNSNKDLIKMNLDGNYSKEKTNPQNNIILNLINENLDNKTIKKIQSTNRNENIFQNIINKSVNDLNNIEEKFNNNQENKKRRYSLQKNRLNSFNGIIMPFSIFTDKKRNNYERISYEPIKCKNKNNNEDNSKLCPKKIKSLNYNKKFNNICSSTLNNCINTINIDCEVNNDIKEKISYSKNDLKENEINNYLDNLKSNQTLDKKEYYYTSRKGKIPYNCFNYLSTKRSKDKVIKNKNKNPISLIDIQNKENFYSAKYNPNINRTNSIYLNNYNKKICRIKKEKFINNSFNKNNAIRKNSFCDLTNKKDNTKQMSNMSNTYFNTNNDTKGCSISSFSLYATKSQKENQSIKNSSRQEISNSIFNDKNKNSNADLSNYNSLDNKKLKRKSKQSIRKYINSINNNESIVQNKNNELEYYYFYTNEKNNQNKLNKLEIDSNVVNECYINNYNSKNKNKKCLYTGKSEKSMTLQSLSDSKILELADHYINNGEDSLDQIDIKLIELRKNFKKEKNCRDITFG